jgi:hypothetical protein
MNAHCSMMVPPSIASTSRNIPTEVLRQITQSGFLTSEELGRLLLVSSKSFIRNVGEEDVWQTICKTRWRHTSQLPRSFFSRGFKSYFRQMSAERPLVYHEDKKISHEADPAPSTSLKIENFLLAVSIRNKSGEIYSKVLKGDELTNFLFKRDGHQKFDFEDDCPIELGRIPANGCRFTHKSIDAADLLQHWSATVHVIRFDTNMCCCIYKATKEYAYQGRHFMSIMGFKLGESITPINQGWIVLKTDTEYTDHLGEETALTRRLDPRGAEQNTRFYNIGIQLMLQCTASLVVTTDIKKEARLVAGGIQLRILNSIYVSGSS